MKIERVNSEIKKTVSQIIAIEMRDPRIQGGMISITNVDTSRDLGLAKIMVSVIGAPDEAQVVEALNSSAGFIRTYIKPMMRIRHMPTLKFFLDESAKHNAQISAIINEINSQKG